MRGWSCFSTILALCVPGLLATTYVHEHFLGPRANLAPVQRSADLPVESQSAVSMGAKGGVVLSGAGVVHVQLEDPEQEVTFRFYRPYCEGLQFSVCFPALEKESDSTPGCDFDECGFHVDTALYTAITNDGASGTRQFFSTHQKGYVKIEVAPRELRIVFAEAHQTFPSCLVDVRATANAFETFFVVRVQRERFEKCDLTLTSGNVAFNAFTSPPTTTPTPAGDASTFANDTNNSSNSDVAGAGAGIRAWWWVVVVVLLLLIISLLVALLAVVLTDRRRQRRRRSEGTRPRTLPPSNDRANRNEAMEI